MCALEEETCVHRSAVPWKDALKKNQLIIGHGKSCERVPTLLLAGDVKGYLVKEMTVQHLEG